jgi:putative nucleotidyltransferase with HDIG domain
MPLSSPARAMPAASPALPESVSTELERRIEQGELELPLLPAAAFEVSREASSPDADPRKLADIIKRDQALLSHVLRIVNSPLYAPRSPIVSLHQAVARLGVTKIREVALLVAMRVGVFHARGFEEEVGRVFRHATAAGLLAQEVARATRRNVEEAFLAGLLHDVGRPVLLQAGVTLLAERVGDYRDALLAFVDQRHARAGGLLARAWALPVALATTIELHHDDAPAAEVAAVRVVQLGDDLARFALDGEPSVEVLAQHPALHELELYSHLLEPVLKQAPNARAMAEAIA